MDYLIRELDKADWNCIDSIAKLHKKAFPSFFLSQLGVSFLRTLYCGYMDDGDSGIIVTEKNGEIIGFIAYSNDYSHFFKGLIKRQVVKFAFCALGASLRHPSFVKRLFGAFKKSKAVVKSERYVELASICVDSDTERRGVGTALINYLKDKVDFNKFAYINLETDAVDNEGVNRFYVKNGFVLAREFVTPEGRKMNEYRYTPEVMV